MDGTSGKKVCPVCIEEMVTPDDYCFVCGELRGPVDPEELLVDRLGATGKLILAIITHRVDQLHECVAVALELESLHMHDRIDFLHGRVDRDELASGPTVEDIVNKLRSVVRP